MALFEQHSKQLLKRKQHSDERMSRAQQLLDMEHRKAMMEEAEKDAARYLSVSGASI